MTGLTDRTAQGLLGHIVGKTAMFVLPTAYVALFTAVGNDAGTGFTEVSGGAYARAATTGASWNAPSGSGPSQITNATPVTYAISTANWGTIVGFGLYDAVTAGNLIAWDYFGSFAWLPCEISAASPGVISASQHGFLAGDSLIYTTEYGGISPTFAQSNLTGILTVTNPLTDTFSVTNGGLAVNTSTSGNGNIRKIIQQAIISGVQPTFPASSLIITAA